MKLSDEIRRSVNGDAWHGPSVREALDGVTAAQALAQPLPPFHSIWELTLHVAAWHQETLAVVCGRPYRDFPPEDQWPPLGESSEAAWQLLVGSIFSLLEELAGEVATLDDHALERPLELRDYTLEFLPPRLRPTQRLSRRPDHAAQEAGIAFTQPPSFPAANQYERTGNFVRTPR